jgi:VanZ family protein
MKRYKILSAILIILILLTLAFIWGNSFATIEESEQQSEKVLDDVKPALETVVGSGNVTEHLIRKLAHFVEYLVLGVMLALLFALLGRHRLQDIVNCAFIGLLAALIDETIQLFTDRGPQVQDVWLDFIGYCAGVLVMAGAVKLIMRVRKSKNRQ